MDVLLVNSPLYEVGYPIHSYADPPPLGLGYIGTELKNNGYTVELLDAVAEGLSVDSVCAKIQQSRPSCVGINVFSTNLNLVGKIISRVEDARIIVGGPAAKYLADDVLNWESSSELTLVIGEAEHVVPAILEGRISVEAGGRLPNRHILTIDSKSAWFPSSIDLPLDRSLFAHEPIHEERWEVWESHIVTSRGCGHDCAFCSAARSVNPSLKIRRRSESHIADELDYICTLHPRVNCIRVLDDLFLRNPIVIERAARLFSTRGLRWRAMGHIAGMASAPRKTFQLLTASGCLELFVGIESGSSSRRKLIGKTPDLAATYRVISELLAAGVSVKGYFILGFPGETELEMQETYEFATKIANYSAHTSGQFRTSAFKFRPYHGTRIYDELISSNRVPSPISEDCGLLIQHNRKPFSFSSDNFSAVSTERLNQFLIDILKLNQ